MKKTVLFVIAFLSLSTLSRAQGIIYLIKRGGSPAGFDHVDQKTDAKGNTKLVCTGAGQSKAEYTAPPDDATNTAPTINKMFSFVDRQLKAGKRSGVASADGLKAEWNGTDAYNYTLTITSDKEK